MKDVRSTVMQLSGRWGNTCYNMLCLAVEAAIFEIGRVVGRRRVLTVEARRRSPAP